ncbi:hypothetical protein [Mesorhizobium sp. RIZ17]|uniref:hypothetical protein n=1 Tax=Mesorhizobium sp. RIZ17 TaxID=3132743 RepID=UPI003DA972A4
MVKLTALGMFVLTIVGVAGELWGLWDYWKMASFARSRQSHAPIPMHDEVDGAPTHVAPSEPARTEDIFLKAGAQFGSLPGRSLKR